MDLEKGLDDDEDNSEFLEMEFDLIDDRFISDCLEADEDRMGGLDVEDISLFLDAEEERMNGLLFWEDISED